MYYVRTYQSDNIIAFALSGNIKRSEMEEFVSEFKKATRALEGKDIKIKADFRDFKPASPEVIEMIRKVREYGLNSGVKRVAEIVGSQYVEAQLNRFSRESNTDKTLRWFWEDESAREWLVHGDTYSKE